ncbi:MAG: exonuclease SbcCD subunit D [Candidatus Hermodarchaeota archaeon]
MVINYNFERKFGAFKKKENDDNKSFKFIHASDIHIGSYQFWNDNRAEDFIRAFCEILCLAIQHRVDFIILGGDVFTSLEILPEKLNRVITILNQFKKFTKETIPIISIEGNHDIRKYSRGVKVNRGQSWLKVLANLGMIILLDANLDNGTNDVFRNYDFQLNKGGKIQIKNAIIYGTRYLGAELDKYLPKIFNAIKTDKECFHILLQHFGIEGQMKNVPGIKLQKVNLLRDKVNYLALGHYHLQFIIDDWIYNPGSSEAACSTDFSYKRGAFLVEVIKNEVFKKKISRIVLNNRKYLWKTIHLNKTFTKKGNLKEFIFYKLRKQLPFLNSKVKISNLDSPFLFLSLKGKKPTKNCRIDLKDLRRKILEEFAVVEVKIYEKYEENTTKIDIYL